MESVDVLAIHSAEEYEALRQEPVFPPTNTNYNNSDAVAPNTENTSKKIPLGGENWLFIGLLGPLVILSTFLAVVWCWRRQKKDSILEEEYRMVRESKAKQSNRQSSQNNNVFIQLSSLS